MAHRTNLRAGFTLIELLIVVVIIGILAAVAIPKFSTTKGKAGLATVKSDLRNLSVQQEGYYYKEGKYATTLAELEIRASPGVKLEIKEANGSGWSAQAQLLIANPDLCAVFVGTAKELAPAKEPGRVACDKAP